MKDGVEQKFTDDEQFLSEECPSNLASVAHLLNSSRVALV